MPREGHKRKGIMDPSVEASVCFLGTNRFSLLGHLKVSPNGLINDL